eukprot:330373_1
MFHGFYSSASTILFLSIITSVSQLIYVSRNGNDSDGCGETVFDACGTLLFASSLVHEKGFGSITVHDGQNEFSVQTYANSNQSPMYHPCLPMPFINSSINITISFNEQYINKMDDWFNKICYSITINTSIKYINSFLFEVYTDGWFGWGWSPMTVNNLHIDNYSSEKIQFGLILYSIMGGMFSCYGCTFKDINFTSYSTPIQVGKDCSFSLINTSFINILSNYNFVTHDGWSLDISNVTFINSVFGQSVILMSTWEDFNGVLEKTLNLSYCSFINIITEESIIHSINNSLSIPSVINIYHSNFENIISGTIIQTDWSAISQITVNHIFISIHQHQSNSYALFSFAENDVVVLSNIIVIYYYNLIHNCHETCNNPVPLMVNEGTVTINGSNLFKINVTLTYFYEYIVRLNLTANYSFKFNGGVKETDAFIFNSGTMFVENLIIDEISFGRIVFLSYGDMTLYNVTMKALEYHSLMLQPDYIIHVKYGILLNNNCRFMGGNYFAIFAEELYGLFVYNTEFKDSSSALSVIGVDEFFMQNCTVHSSYKFDAVISIIQILQANTAILSYNKISCNNQFGLAMFWRVNNLSIHDNIFILTTVDLFHNESLDMPFYGQTWSIYPYPGWITIRLCLTTNVINNEFILSAFVQSNQWVPHMDRYGNFHGIKKIVAWMSYSDNYGIDNNGIHCFSGNSFTNFAFVLSNTNLTSCARPKLINCLKNKYECNNGFYGDINEYIIYESHFITTMNISYIWQIFNNYIAFDNIRIHSNQSIIIKEGNLFLLDSYFASNDQHIHDIWYDNASCDLVINERYTLNSNYIARFTILCYDWIDNGHNTSDCELVNSMNDAAIKTVLHFSATTFYFYADNNDYWPGSPLLFYYEITDVFGNIVNITTNSSFLISVNNDALSLSVTIKIDEQGYCDFCHSGIILFGARLDGLGGPYDIVVDLKSEYLRLGNEHIYLDIVGCPVRYGSVKNSHQCQECPTTTYNLHENNSNECFPCSETINKAITCSDGSIFIDNNNWIHVNEDRSLLSSLCAYGYCCQNNKKCEYISSLKEHTLCALNRDPNSTLCSKCITGYSQVFQATQCQKCDGIHAFPVIIILLYGLSMATVILFMHSDTTKLSPNEHSTNPCKQYIKSLAIKCINLAKSHFGTTATLILFKGVLYYEQSLSQIIIHSTISTSKISWWISLFNISIFQYGGNAGDNDGFCFYNGMTAKQSLLSGFMLLFIIIVTLVLFKMTLSSITLFGHLLKPNYTKSFLFYLLFSVGKIASILFSLLSCQEIYNSNT